MPSRNIDIQENEILKHSPEVLSLLLRDCTLSSPQQQVNIFWATDNYVDKGAGYQYFDNITSEAITGTNGDVIVPRAVKSSRQQMQRSRDMAEVFTPAWICNRQNNIVDSAWFGRDGVFNTETDNRDGSHSWIVNPEPIVFPRGKTWRDYVRETRLEITCGEAPYLASRYDTVTGEFIPIEHRIGLLDRKLRIVGENTDVPRKWLDGAKMAYKNIYGYEWVGDSLLLARETLLRSFIEYYRQKFGATPRQQSILEIAGIISWNIWQMDGLKYVIPHSCSPDCSGCKSRNRHRHNGKYCKIMDWDKGVPVEFVSLISEPNHAG